MKKWSEVEKDAIDRYLNGSARSARVIYRTIDGSLCSMAMLPSVLMDYPNTSNVEPDGLMLKTDMELLLNIRIKMAAILQNKVVKQLNVTNKEESDNIYKFILEWLTINWEQVLTRYLNQLKKKLRLFIK